jgi:serine/threonine protein kinase
MALEQEVDIMSQMDHPNIVRLFEIFEEDSNYYLVMEIM